MQERQERLKSLGAQFSVKSSVMNSGSRNCNTSEGGTAEVLGDPLKGYIVNVVRDAGEEPVRIPPSISSKLKPHQVHFFIIDYLSFTSLHTIFAIRNASPLNISDFCI